MVNAYSVILHSAIIALAAKILAHHAIQERSFPIIRAMINVQMGNMKSMGYVTPALQTAKNAVGDL